MKRPESISFIQSDNWKKINRGDVFYLENISTYLLIISNRMHNLFAHYLNAILVVDENEVRESLEVLFETEEKKFKAVVCCLYTINKQELNEQGVFVSRVNEKAMEKINERIKSLLDLND